MYALSLPIERPRFFVFRYLAGLLWLGVPLLLLALASFAVSSLAGLPRGMHAYPAAFTVWAAVASALHTVMWLLAARFARPWIVLLSAAGVYLALYTLLVLGTFPILSLLAEAVTWGGISPLRLLFDAPYLFDV